MIFTLNQQIEGRVNYNMAISWNDVTARQFYQLKKWDSKAEFADLNLISILSGIPFGALLSMQDMNIKVDGKTWPVDDYLWQFTSFITESKIEDHLKDIEFITIKDKPYPVPKELNKPGNGQRFVLAQKNAMRDRLVKTINETGDAINCAEFITACYFYPIVNEVTFDTSDNPDNKFKSEEAEKFIEVLKGCKMVELYSVHNFFLKKLIVSQIVRQPSLALNQIKIKGLRKLVRSMFSKRLTQSMLSQEVIC